MGSSVEKSHFGCRVQVHEDNSVRILAGGEGIERGLFCEPGEIVQGSGLELESSGREGNVPLLRSSILSSQGANRSMSTTCLVPPEQTSI